MHPKTPISIALIVNILMTTLIAVIAGMTAFWAINSAVERAVKQDVSRDISVMLDRAPERGVIPDIAVLTGSVGRRIFVDTTDSDEPVYLLANHAGEKIVGNVDMPPDVVANSWMELDGIDLGAAPGPILIRTVTVGPDHILVVGRRLTARAALNRWLVPTLAGGVIFLGLCSSLLLGFLNRGFRARVQHINAVFQRVELGELDARISFPDDQSSTDDISVLARNVNSALAEVERLLRGLESYSQVAAHELNHSITMLRDRISEAGEPEIARQAERLIDLVTHILELAKIEATPGFAMQKIRLGEVVQSAVSLYADAFEDASVTLNIHFLNGEAEILGSKPLIESALINLISNALKHAPPHSSVMVCVKQDAQSVSLSVEDQGEGVASTMLGDLVAIGRSGASGGYGFGLRHVEAVAIRHGAQFHLENTVPGLRATLVFRTLN